MMKSQKAALGYPLATIVLHDRFRKDRRTLAMFEQERSNCSGILFTRNGKFLYARAMMAEVNRMICDSLIESLPDAKKRFVMMKYRDGAQLVNISMNLYISIAQLNVWNQNILSVLSSLLSFQLTQGDIFYRGRVVNMVEILARLVEFFARIDPDMEIAPKEYIACLKAKHYSYSQLLAMLDDAVRSKSTSPYFEAVTTKMRYPDDTISFLASKCHMDKGIVSRYVKTFVNEMKQYVEI